MNQWKDSIITFLEKYLHVFLFLLFEGLNLCFPFKPLSNDIFHEAYDNCTEYYLPQKVKTQSVHFRLIAFGESLQKWADDQFFCITEGSIYYIKHM